MTDPNAADGADGTIDWNAGGRPPRPDADPPAGASSSESPAADPPGSDLAGDAAATEHQQGSSGVGHPAPDRSPAAGPTADPAGAEPDGDDDGDEAILDDIAGLEATVEAERDEYLERLQRLQAEFENYRKRMTREQAGAHERGAQSLATELLPVLDACEAARQQGRDDVEPIHSQLTELLTRAGLERNGAPGEPFDPELHEAVMHEPAEEGGGVSEIAEVLRAGYSWKGRVLRPAMVKVRG